jgi:hypothetical protein
MPSPATADAGEPRDIPSSIVAFCGRANNHLQLARRLDET